MDSCILTYELNKLLVKIEEKTYNYLFGNKKIIQTLLSYCEKEGFGKRYDCLFWDKDGYNWEYNQNPEVVSLVDKFFLLYKATYHPQLPEMGYSIDNVYKTRLDYILRQC